MKERYGYMCLIDYNQELGEDVDGTKIYPTIEDLIENHRCAEKCGIVKVKVTIEST